jgi:hypothetical protein
VCHADVEFGVKVHLPEDEVQVSEKGNRQVEKAQKARRENLRYP